MFDVRGDAYKNVLEMWKRWYDTGIITKDSFLQEEWKNTWNKGNTTCVQTGAAWAMAQSRKIYGAQNVVPLTNFVLNKGDTPKTFTFANGAILFKKANNPQEITDWLLWMLDPTIEKIANHSFHKGDLNYYHMPAYRGIYENIIPSNPDWVWMEQMLPMVEASQTIPTDAHLNIYGPIAKTWHEKYIFGECSLEECVDAIYEEEREQTQKLVEGEL
jgi:ABC-type glycerol-3-phosphate transport system substrate-binding protein